MILSDTKQANTLLLLSLFLFSKQILATKYYISIDKNGYKQISDTIPVNSQYHIKEYSDIQVTQWQKGHPVKTSSKRLKAKKNNQNQEQIKKGLCLKQKKQIKTLQNKLSQKQKAKIFDIYKKQLSQIRWLYRKKCV